MSPFAHRLYLIVLSSIVVLTTIYLIFSGSNYYFTSLEERFYHPDHARLKPSGIYGHGLGIFGTLLIIIGVVGYMARKRFRSLSRIGVLKHWLEFHIFLCTIGPIMVLFHTAFKFGGIVSVSFWSMVAVVASGVVGRFIYLQIPRTIQGRELSLSEVHEMKSNVSANVKQTIEKLPPAIIQLLDTNNYISETGYNKKGFFGQYLSDWKRKNNVKKQLNLLHIPGAEVKTIVQRVKDEMGISRKIQRLVTMQKYFRYWHIAHLPFALIMMIIMVIHVAITLTFGYKWIF
ncbi:MAG: hypothetical protein ACOYOA_03965 [Saprospiraceae bacterium]